MEVTDNLLDSCRGSVGFEYLLPAPPDLSAKKSGAGG